MSAPKLRRPRLALRLGFLLIGLICAPAAGQPPSMIWPLSGSPDGQMSLDRLNSPFGPRIRASTNSYEFHEGIDLAGPAGSEVHIGDPVLAAANGISSLLTDDAGCVIRNGNETAPPGCMPLFPGPARILRPA